MSDGESDVLLVFLPCAPDIGWGLTRGGLAALLPPRTPPSEVDEVWTAILDHDRLFYEHRWFEWASSSSDAEIRHEYATLAEIGRSEQIAAALEKRRAQLEAVLHESLSRRVGQCLRGDAETAFVALAGRLRGLPTWVDDGYGRAAILRVCELTGTVFRGTSRARFLTGLPRQAKRVSRTNVWRIGTRFPPADPLAPYAREVWSLVECDHCRELCETRNAGRVYCSDRCKVAAFRERKSQQREDADSDGLVC